MVPANCGFRMFALSGPLKWNAEMNQLICMRHPKYEGRSPPVLACKTCCTIFVDAVKVTNQGRTFNPYEFLNRKTKEAQSAHGQSSDFNPETI